MPFRNAYVVTPYKMLFLLPLLSFFFVNKSLVRMDGAPVGSIVLAQARQKTSALYRVPSCAYTNDSIPGGRLFDFQVRG